MCSSRSKNPLPRPSSLPPLVSLSAYALSLSLSFSSLLSLHYFLPLPRNWYYYGPVRPSHYVINVTRVDYRSLFRTCLQCPRTMLDPLPPSPPLLSPLTTDSFLGPYAHRKNVENVDIDDDDDDDDDELTPRFNLTPGYEDKKSCVRVADESLWILFFRYENRSFDPIFGHISTNRRGKIQNEIESLLFSRDFPRWNSNML